MRLSHKDYAVLEQAIYELYEPRNLKSFLGDIPAILSKLVHSDYSGWYEYQIKSPGEPAILAKMAESVPATKSEVAKDLAKNITKHPFTKYFIESCGDQTALKLSDFLTQAQLQRTFISDLYRRWGNFRHNLAIPVNGEIGTACAIGFCNVKNDFTERDRLMLNLFRRHFDRAHRNAKIATSRAGVTVVSMKGYGFSARETEISLWLAQGKSNRDISLILHANLRTVEKHVEQILRKLGVENRTAAALLINAALLPPSR